MNVRSEKIVRKCSCNNKDNCETYHQWNTWQVRIIFDCYKCPTASNHARSTKFPNPNDDESLAWKRLQVELPHIEHLPSPESIPEYSSHL